jgi:NADPH:quinone reductase-like Zn-dependent oxidoreductase
MKAIIFYEQGGIDKLKYEDVPEPKLKADEVLVKVSACAINRLDLRARQDRPEVEPMPHILGSDVAGEVVKVDSKVEGIEVGQRVVIFPIISCGRCEFCLSGDESICDQQKVFGFQTNGGYAEFVTVPATNLIPISDSISSESAAAIPIAYLTAWRMLMKIAKLRTEEDVLVLSAGSGVGSAAVQIAKRCGARVIATAGSEAKVQKALEIGADFAINYRERDFAQAVMEITSNRGVDVVVEHVGAHTWEKSLSCLAKRGRLVTCGVTTGNIAPVNIREIYRRQISIMGSALGNKGELLEVMKLAAQGKLKPIIDKILPLKEAAQAHKILENRDHFGKIVLKP